MLVVPAVAVEQALRVDDLLVPREVLGGMDRGQGRAQGVRDPPPQKKELKYAKRVMGNFKKTMISTVALQRAQGPEWTVFSTFFDNLVSFFREQFKRDYLGAFVNPFFLTART